MTVEAALSHYFETLAERMGAMTATDASGAPLTLDDAADRLREEGARVRAAGKKAVLLGNGGSLATASHFAIDFTKNGGLPAITCTDPTTLTCLGNDYGFEDAYARFLDFYAEEGDWLIAVSCSGRSPNVLKAAARARAAAMTITTLSGFDADNPLRALGEVNVHVASHAYGIVEIAHMAFLHGVLDLAMGWTPAAADAQPSEAWSAPFDG